MDNLEQVLPTETDEQRVARRHREQEEGRKIVVERERATKLESELINTYVERAKENPNSLYELHDRLPELADKVASKFTRGNGSRYNSFSEYSDSLSNDSKPVFKNSMSVDELETWYANKKKQEQFEQAKSVVPEAFKGLSEEDREKAQTEYDELFGNQMFSPEDALRRAKLIAKGYTHRVDPRAPISPAGGNYIAPRQNDEKPSSDLSALAERMRLKI